MKTPITILKSIYMIYLLSCMVTIGKAQLNQVHSIIIKNSVKQLADEATLVVPRNIPAFNSTAYLHEVIKEGDPVHIELGYNGHNYQEFKGYVKKISTNESLKIACEDEMYRLRYRPAPAGEYSHITLYDFLQKISPHTSIQTDIQMTLEKFVVHKGASVYDVLFALKKDPYNLYGYFDEHILRIGFAYDIRKSTPKTYHMQRHVVQNQLEYLHAEGRNYKIKAISLPMGKKPSSHSENLMAFYIRLTFLMSFTRH